MSEALASADTGQDKKKDKSGLRNVDQDATGARDTLALSYAALALVLNNMTYESQQLHSSAELRAVFMQSECFGRSAAQALCSFE